MSDLDPKQVVASFDSASVLHAATVAALNGQPFPNLGSSSSAGLAVRVAGRLPWSMLRGIYSRIGASEGINPRRLGEVDLSAVAESFAARYPQRRYAAVLLGSSNGALTHLAAAMQVPWLPDTVLVPVAHVGDTDRPDQALDFGRSVAPALLDRNPDVVLHHMHDQLQDLLMAERMSYFRVKWCRLPGAYATFVDERLAPGGTVVVVGVPSAPVTVPLRRVVAVVRLPRGFSRSRILRRQTRGRLRPSGASTQISVKTCTTGALHVATGTPRSATTAHRQPQLRWRQ